MSYEEANLFHRSRKKPNEGVSPTAPARKVSFVIPLQSLIDEYNMSFATQGLDNINFKDKQDNLNNHPNSIPITTIEKHRLYSLVVLINH